MIDVPNTLAGRRLLISGATGFLGKVLVAWLLEHCPGVHLQLVVRTRGRVETPVRRIERLIDTSPAFRPLRHRHGPALGRWLGERLCAVSGDVEKPSWGLDAAALADLQGTDVVIHCAGLTDFAPDPLRALAANTAGAVHGANLARALGARLIHVSTAFVCGRRDGPVDEVVHPGIAPNGAAFDPAETVRRLLVDLRGAPDAEARAAIGGTVAEALGWPNVYTLTKGLAEHLVAARLPDAVIVRPSIVECARRYPFPGWNEGLNTSGPLAWLISTAFRDLPARDELPFDVVPVDDVAAGIALSCAAACLGRAPPVVHLCSSDVNLLTLGRTIELTGLAMRRWCRTHGRPVDRLLFQHLDPVAVPADDPGPFAPARLREWVAQAGTWFADSPRWREADVELERVERMLRLYRPFIHDHAPVFRTDGIRRLGQDNPAPYRFDVTDIDWRRYWIDVEYPGLRQWCIPLVYGQRAPLDPPSSPPLRIAASSPERLAAK